MNQKENKQELKRQLSPMHVWALAFGCVVGWGSFINPGKKFLPNSGVAGTAIAMVLGAMVMIIIAFSYAYMVPKYPKAGGEFTFTKACFGKTTAYLCGWFLLAAYLTNVPMNSTAIGLIVDGLDGPLPNRGIRCLGGRDALSHGHSDPFRSVEYFGRGESRYFTDDSGGSPGRLRADPDGCRAVQRKGLHSQHGALVGIR